MLELSRQAEAEIKTIESILKSWDENPKESIAEIRQSISIEERVLKKEAKEYEAYTEEWKKKGYREFYDGYLLCLDKLPTVSALVEREDTEQAYEDMYAEICQAYLDCQDGKITKYQADRIAELYRYSLYALLLKNPVLVDRIRAILVSVAHIKNIIFIANNT